jgi:hypothetical protein
MDARFDASGPGPSAERGFLDVIWLQDRDHGRIDTCATQRLETCKHFRKLDLSYSCEMRRIN